MKRLLLALTLVLVFAFPTSALAYNVGDQTPNGPIMLICIPQTNNGMLYTDGPVGTWKEYLEPALTGSSGFVGAMSNPGALVSGNPNSSCDPILGFNNGYNNNYNNGYNNHYNNNYNNGYNNGYNNHYNNHYNNGYKAPVK